MWTEQGDNTTGRTGALPARTQTQVSKASRADPETMATFSQDPRSAGRFTVMKVKLANQTTGLDQAW